MAAYAFITLPPTAKSFAIRSGNDADPYPYSLPQSSVECIYCLPSSTDSFIIDTPVLAARFFPYLANILDASLGNSLSYTF